MCYITTVHTVSFHVDVVVAAVVACQLVMSLLSAATRGAVDSKLIQTWVQLHLGACSSVVAQVGRTP
jgi:hypothetical protein